MITVGMRRDLSLAQINVLIASVFTLATIPVLAQTPYGSCSSRAEVYQRRYEQFMQARDLVCYQKALERELSGSRRFNCPRTAQYYQRSYERSMNSSDLVCYQQALERELR